MFIFHSKGLGMDISIQGNNIVIADNVRAYAQERLAKLSRYLPNIVGIRTDITKKEHSRGPDQITVQITLRHSRGAILRAEEKSELSGGGDAVKAALHGALDKMYKQIERFKGKRREIRQPEDRYQATQEELDVAEDIPTIEELMAPDAGWKEPQIIRRKQVAISAMNDEEAVQQMELLGHDFFMYFNADDNRVQVLYRRASGGYGVLVPDVE
jgi:putative sigma-54 modulation protein